MRPIPDETEVEQRLRQWAEVTSLSLALLEASIKREFPDSPEQDLQDRLIQRLRALRRLRV